MKFSAQVVKPAAEKPVEAGLASSARPHPFLFSGTLTMSAIRSLSASATVLALALSAAFAAPASAQVTVVAAAPATAPAEAAAETLAAGAPLATLKEKMSYSTGVMTARTLVKNGVAFDPELLMQGLRDGLAGGAIRIGEKDLKVTRRDDSDDSKQ
jgi:hypothetical protein